MIKKIRSSLFAKVFVITAVLLTGMSFLVYGILAWRMPQTYSNRLNAALDEKVKVFLSRVELLSATESRSLFDEFLNDPAIDGIKLFTEDGHQVPLPSMETAISEEATTENNIAIYEDGSDNAPIMSGSYMFSFREDERNYQLVVYGSAEEVAELQQSFLKVLPLLTFIVIFASFIISWVYSHIITRPVLKISRISKEMSELQLEWQLDEHRSDELGVLEKSLNHLSRQLSMSLHHLQEANRQLEEQIEYEKALEQSQLSFFSAASHELKTPITIMKGQLEGMILGIGDYQNREKYLRRSLEVANMLERMVQEILTISGLETFSGISENDICDCVPIIYDYLRKIEDSIAEKDLQVQADMPERVIIAGNKLLIEKLFSNLIGNAVQYSPDEAIIRIIIHEQEEYYHFAVENTGDAIPEEAMPKLFEAFFRVEQSRNRKTGGSGLGLYIVQKILHQYGSKCIVTNMENGVRFSFSLHINHK